MKKKNIEILEVEVSRRKMNELREKGITKQILQKKLTEEVKILGIEIGPIKFEGRR